MEMKITVAVAGGFDPLHAGHLEHIRQAKKLGDYLVVILNPDEDIIRKRGIVFMPMGQRYMLLKALKDVDEIIIAIDGDGTVAKTLLMIRPDIFAKGGDRTSGNMPQNELEICQQIGCQIVYNVGNQLASSTDLLRRFREYKGDIKHRPSGGDFR